MLPQKSDWLIALEFAAGVIVLIWVVRAAISLAFAQDEPDEPDYDEGTAFVLSECLRTGLPVFANRQDDGTLRVEYGGEHDPRAGDAVAATLPAEPFPSSAPAPASKPPHDANEVAQGRLYSTAWRRAIGCSPAIPGSISIEEAVRSGRDNEFPPIITAAPPSPACCNDTNSKGH